jgi:hypothetical protein
VAKNAGGRGREGEEVTVGFMLEARANEVRSCLRCSQGADLLGNSKRTSLIDISERLRRKEM